MSMTLDRITKRERIILDNLAAEIAWSLRKARADLEAERQRRERRADARRATRAGAA
jgi:hypothetical protein